MEKKLDLATYCTSIDIEDGVRIDLFTPSMFRVRISKLEGEKFPEKYQIPFAIGRLENWPEVKYTTRKDSSFQFVETDRIQIRMAPQGSSWSVCMADGCRIVYPSNGPLRGLFKDGYAMFDSASAFNEENFNSRYAHWFYDPGTGTYVDEYLAEDLIMDTFFIYGPDYPTLFNQFNQLVGPEPLPPKKGFGFMQTQHKGETGCQASTMEVARKLRAKDLPCDYLILDFEWGDCPDGTEEHEDSAGKGWGAGLEFKKEYCSPVPAEEMVKQLKNDNLDLLLIHHSAPKFKNRAEQGWTSVEYPEDVWFNAYNKLTDMGITGTWQDTRRNDVTESLIFKRAQDYLGDKERVLFLGARQMYRNRGWGEDPITTPMNNIIGSRRTPCDWTGDCGNNWAELRWQIETIVNTHGAMKGITYLTNDSIGANWRVKARWMQFQAFNTICRAHNQKPWNEGDNVHKIENYGKKLVDRLNEEIKQGRRYAQATLDAVLESPAMPWDEALERSIRKHFKLRYRLLPYLYSFAHINYRTGMPICRPMLLAFPVESNCNENQWPRQYMFGENIMVAPVCEDINEMELYLPTGEQWIDYWDKTIYEGGQVISYDVSDIEKLPLFVRADSIIPMQEECNWIDPAQPLNELTLDIYPAADCKFVMYEDDGVSLHYQSGAYATTMMDCTKEGERLTLSIGATKGEYKNKPAERIYRLKINLQVEEPSEILVNDELVDDWSYDTEGRALLVTVRAAMDRPCKVIVS